jgi:hypothetical protein
MPRGQEGSANTSDKHTISIFLFFQYASLFLLYVSTLNNDVVTQRNKATTSTYNNVLPFCTIYYQLLS